MFPRGNVYWYACTHVMAAQQAVHAYFGTKGGLCNDSSSCALGLVGEEVSPADARRGTVGRDSLCRQEQEIDVNVLRGIKVLETSLTILYIL